MKKKIIVILSFLLILSTVVFATEDASSYIIDEADILSTADEVLLVNDISQLKSEYDFELHIITLKSFDGDSLLSYADEFRSNEDYDGLVFVFNTDELNREYAISTSGEAMYLFDDADLDYIDVYIIPLLASGNYFEAFDELIYTTEEIIIEGTDYDYYEDLYENNDFDLDPEEMGGSSSFDTDLLIPIVVALAVAIFLTFSIIGSMKAKMNTARKQSSAVIYLDSDSLNLNISNDRFLYENTTRTRKSQSSSSSSSGIRSVGGGRRRNSSGRSRGGRSRRF